jgi:hypothetical protein
MQRVLHHTVPSRRGRKKTTTKKTIKDKGEKLGTRGSLEVIPLYAQDVTFSGFCLRNLKGEGGGEERPGHIKKTQTKERQARLFSTMVPCGEVKRSDNE